MVTDVPDTDNDGDGIEDVNDKCPMEPEDKDNFQDDDGCPDFDNDGDGIPDSLDKCPNLPEDIDLFEDDDGCPDYDNDKDGIADTVDNCISEPETYNGYKDDDGCPDTLIRPSEKETTVLNTKLRAINFKTGSAELLPVSFAALDFIADFLKQYSHLRYEIQGHTDDQGSDEYNLVLSAARAGTVRAYLLSKGIPKAVSWLSAMV
jgi:outer membrane protein OmpA-like peptidoglycan-associated protein